MNKTLVLLLAPAVMLASCYRSSGPEADGSSGEDAGEDREADAADGEANGRCPGGTYMQREIPVREHVDVDILVVVDNSGSMESEQYMLRDAFPDLISSILTGNDSEGNRIHEPVRDLHIGVVSTDMGVGGYAVQTCESDPVVGDDGVLRHTPHGEDCDPFYPNYLTYQIPETAEPFIGDISKLARDFGCIAVLGTDGCGFEQQLEAAYKALTVHTQPGGPNAGFLREDSILVVLFVTDEEDCSAADVSIFDILSLPYSINLQCYYQAAKLHPVSRYEEALRGLRPDPGMLVLGFIAGVPPGEACEGRGDEIGGCLEVPAMQESVRPDGEDLEYACVFPPTCTPPDPPYPGDCMSSAFPARRMVQLAQRFGESAAVASVCTDSFVPAIEALTGRLRAALQAQAPGPLVLEMEKDPANPCRCTVPCTIIEELGDDRACPDYEGDGAVNYYDGDGDGSPDFAIDEVTGTRRSLCEIPQAGSFITSDCTLPCDDPGADLAKDFDRAGWWYDPHAETGAGTAPALLFEGVRPQEGSRLFIECCFR